jgi:hypothetical protein
MNPENMIRSTLVLSLEDFTNSELAALNNSITGFGNVTITNYSYAKALSCDFINKEGTVKSDIKEYLIDAMAFEINKRVAENRFN